MQAIDFGKVVSAMWMWPTKWTHEIMRLSMIQQTEVDTEMGKSEPIIDSPLQALKWGTINSGVPYFVFGFLVPGLLSSALVISLLSLPSLSLILRKNPTQWDYMCGWINLEIQRLDNVKEMKDLTHNVIQVSDAHDAFCVLGVLLAGKVNNSALQACAANIGGALATISGSASFMAEANLLENFWPGTQRQLLKHQFI